MGEQVTIVDPQGRPIERAKKKNHMPPGSCPNCGAGQERRISTLTGLSYCICGQKVEDGK